MCVCDFSYGLDIVCMCRVCRYDYYFAFYHIFYLKNKSIEDKSCVGVRVRVCVCVMCVMISWLWLYCAHIYYVYKM